ncbi:MAG TPA: hypothetical protein P5060_00785 [Candidatus Absconditabacterales bacterium]|nr:hypothetical protein [Candidatus Absconditabacterales bacterium]
MTKFIKKQIKKNHKKLKKFINQNQITLYFSAGFITMSILTLAIF